MDSIPENIKDMQEFTAELWRVIWMSKAHAAIVVLFAGDEYKSFQFGADDEAEYLMAVKCIAAHGLKET